MRANQGESHMKLQAHMIQMSPLLVTTTAMVPSSLTQVETGSEHVPIL